MPKGRRSDFNYQRHQPDMNMGRVLPRRVREGLDEADELIESGSLVEARSLLEDLNRQYPNQEAVLIALFNVKFELDDMLGTATTAEQLLKVSPRNPEANLTLAGSYLQLVFPMLALRQFHHFLKLFLSHPKAEEVRQTIAELEPETRSRLDAMGLSGSQQTELAEKHEQAQLYLAQGKNAEGRRLCEEIIRVKPDFVSAYNNLSLLHCADGRYAEAIAAAQKALRLDSKNLHALSNLTRYYVSTGAIDEARVAAHKLKTIAYSDNTDEHIKKIEAFSYIGEDESVLDEVNAVQKRDAAYKAVLPNAHFMWHLGAVAAQRLGNPKQAAALWKQALTIAPGFELAQENLDDLSLPISERSGAWPFSLQYWLRHKIVEDLIRELTVVEKKKAATDKDEAQLMTIAVRNILGKYPEVKAVVPMLLDRGDLQGRQIAMLIAQQSKAPELLTALSSFVHSHNGPDSMRMEAGITLREAGLLPPGPIRLWSAGEWRELQLLGFQISSEAIDHLHAPKVQALSDEALKLLRNKRPEKAEHLLTEALALEPESPDLLNNLSKAYEMQDRIEESHALLQEIHQRFPDYLFARTALATLNAQEGRIEEARELLDPLMARAKFHLSEYSAFAIANFELSLAQDAPDAAKSWLDMLERARPNEASLPSLRLRLQTSGLMHRITRRMRRG